MVEWTKDIGDYGFKTYICHTKIKKYYVVQSRDFVALASSSTYNNGSIIVMPSKSIDHDEAQITKECIRGHCYVS